MWWYFSQSGWFLIFFSSWIKCFCKCIWTSMNEQISWLPWRYRSPLLPTKHACTNALIHTLMHVLYSYILLLMLFWPPLYSRIQNLKKLLPKVLSLASYYSQFKVMSLRREKNEERVHSSCVFVPNPGFSNGWNNYPLAFQMSDNVSFLPSGIDENSLLYGHLKKLLKELFGLALFFHLTVLKYFLLKYFIQIYHLDARII